MDQVTVFNFREESVRVVTDESGSPWFVAKDIAEALGYSETAMMTRRLDDDEMQKFASAEMAGANPMAREFTIINESGLYNAILGSSKPEAKAFKKWITSEVLPAIRRDGGYIKAGEDETNEELLARAMLVANATIARRDEQLKAAQMQIDSLAPDAAYTRKVLLANNLHTCNEIAAQLGVSAIRLNRFLLLTGLVYRQGGQLLPATWCRDRGYCGMHIITYATDENGNPKTRAHLKWTEAGRRAIVELWNKQKVA